jgi:hypothetical protein
MAIDPSPTAEATRVTEPYLITVLEGFIRRHFERPLIGAKGRGSSKQAPDPWLN